MAKVLAPMTELEAVNRMLASIGQAPVSSLEVSGIGDVDKAKTQLAETNRDVQTIGWWFNTDEDYTLTPNASGIIKIPQGALDVEPVDKTRKLAERRDPNGNMALYDLDERSFVFTEGVDSRIIWGFGFNDIPQAARSYIATAAARRFQAQQVASPVLDRYTEEDQELAWTLLQRRERASRNTNAFSANPRRRLGGGRRYFR